MNVDSRLERFAGALDYFGLRIHRHIDFVDRMISGITWWGAGRVVAVLLLAWLQVLVITGFFKERRMRV
jgi:hypothetical protein